MSFLTGLKPHNSIPPFHVSKTTVFLTLAAFVVGIMVGRSTPEIQTVKVVDTLRIHDTVFASASWSLGAYRCDSLHLEGRGLFGYGGSVQKGSEIHTYTSGWPRWTVWGGIGYTWRVGIRPYVGVWWWPRSYFGIGAYAVPVYPYAVGVGVGVRF